MPNQFVATQTTGFGQRIMNSVLGVFFGILLFFGSFVVLYLNEGRFDYSTLARSSVEISTTNQADTSLNGKLISATGTLSSNETIGDGMYLKPGKYVDIRRVVEMWAWQETARSQTQQHAGGSETTQTTYTYSTGWTDIPQDSANFKIPDGHVNPQKLLDDSENRVNTASIGSYNIDMNSVALPSGAKVELTADNTMLSRTQAPANQNPSLQNGYVFVSATPNAGSTIGNPQVGDIRISYYAIPSGQTVTIFGALRDSNIDSYIDQHNHRFFQVFLGSRNDAIASLHSQYELWLWIFRGVGFLMMFFGMLMVVGPITTLLSILPILGEMGGLIFGLAILPVAIILTLITILISMVIHTVVALVAAILVTIAIIIFLAIRWEKNRKKDVKQPTQINPPSPAA